MNLIFVMQINILVFENFRQLLSEMPKYIEFDES